VDYKLFIETKTAGKWKSIGLDRRAGVAVPLFSIYSKDSIGIGEFPDLKLLVKWCLKTNMSIIQLLPLNDTDSDFSPYNSISSFALDPMYISLTKMKDVNINPFKKSLRSLKKLFETGGSKVNYEIKKEKIKLLYEIFLKSYTKGINSFESFKSDNSYWLRDYALFKVIKDFTGETHWEKWSENLKNRNTDTLLTIEEEYSEKINFEYWIQWQLFEQILLFKKYASKNGIFIIGDLPFLVNRNSADVWSHQKYFDLTLSAGAPPDMYFANGQRWGMPPYNHIELEKDCYEYIKEKLKYSINFYDMYRIDHFVGLFRIWTIDINSDLSEAGLNGKFIPAEVEKWADNGRKFLDVMINNSSLLPVAEDLGTVPECSSKVLLEYGVPGMNVQRWTKDEKYDYIDSDKYRLNSVATLSTHDSSTAMEWWKYEAGTVDEKLFERLCLAKNILPEDYDMIKKELFDLSNSFNGRLLWKNEIDNVEKFLSVFGFGYEFNEDIINLYIESYNEKRKYLNFINLKNTDENKLDTDFQFKALKNVINSSSVFAVNLLQEWLMLDEKFFMKYSEKSCRINIPGMVNDTNWTFVLPYSLEYMLDIGTNAKIRKLNIEAKRK
jgi:4-alpha-glucanotransferase